MDPELGLESAARLYEERDSRVQLGRQVRGVGAPPSVWGGASERNYVVNVISSMTHGHWPPPVDEFARVVMDACRAVIARVSRTGSPDWSTVNFGPGHGVAGISVSVAEPAVDAMLPATVTLSIWELDINDNEAAASASDGDGVDLQWASAVKARLEGIVGPELRDRSGSYRYRSTSGEAIFPYARLELLADRVAPRSMDDMTDLALTCGRLAAASVLVYDLIEQRAVAEGV